MLLRYFVILTLFEYVEVNLPEVTDIKYMTNSNIILTGSVPFSYITALKLTLFQCSIVLIE